MTQSGHWPFGDKPPARCYCRLTGLRRIPDSPGRRLMKVAPIALGLLVTASLPSPAFARGGLHLLDPAWNPQHINGMPAEVRNALTHMCGDSQAEHQFASYSQNLRFLVLHFERFRCGNRRALCTQSGCLHQVYVSTGGHYRLLSSYHASDDQSVAPPRPTAVGGRETAGVRLWWALRGESIAPACISNLIWQGCFGTKRTCLSRRLMSASLIGRLGSSAFRLSTNSSVDVAHGLSLLFGLGTKGPSIMGFEDEVEQSFGRPCRQCDGRFKRTYELTSSIVPRGTSFHRGVELDFLLLHWILHSSQATATSLVHRNSV